MDIENIPISTILSLIVTFAAAITSWGVISKKLTQKIQNIASEGMDDKIGKNIDGHLNGISKMLSETNRDMKSIKKSMQDIIRQSVTKAHSEIVEKEYVSEYDFYAITQLYSDFQNIGNGQDTLVADLYGDIADIYQKCHSSQIKIRR